MCCSRRVIDDHANDQQDMENRKLAAAVGSKQHDMARTADKNPITTIISSSTFIQNFHFDFAAIL